MTTIQEIMDKSYAVSDIRAFMCVFVSVCVVLCLEYLLL